MEIRIIRASCFGSETLTRHAQSEQFWGLPMRKTTGQARSDYAPFAVRMQNHRFFAGTGLRNGDLIGQNGLNGAASGWEMDSSRQLPPPHSPGAPPANLQILAEGTNNRPNNDWAGQMTYYDTESGGFVFAAGSLTFGGSLAVDPKLQQIVRNVLNECLERKSPRISKHSKTLRRLGPRHRPVVTLKE
jgi:hypothetical protein